MSERRNDLTAVNSWLPRARDTSNGRKFDLAVDVYWIKACLAAGQCLACGWINPEPQGTPRLAIRALTDHIAGVP